MHRHSTVKLTCLNALLLMRIVYSLCAKDEFLNNFIFYFLILFAYFGIVVQTLLDMQANIRIHMFSNVRRSSQTGELTGTDRLFPVSDRVRVTILLN